MGARPTEAVILLQDPVEVVHCGIAQEQHEGGGVLDGLPGPLAEVGGHRVGGVAEQHAPASNEGAREAGEVVDVVPEDVLWRGRVDEFKDRGVPGAEVAAE
nr:hypothetical protein [Kytococcus sedentarius]